MAKRAGHRQISAQVTNQAAAGWSLWVEESGCDLTSLLEVMGLRLAEGRGHREAMSDIVAEARHVQAARRRRSRRTD